MTEPFDGIDLSLPDEQLAEWLSFVLDRRSAVDDDDNQVVTLSGQETELLRKWSRAAGPKTRRVAVGFLVDFCPCSWDELETWARDDDQDVRHQVVYGGYGLAREQLRSDKARWICLLSEAAERYPDDYQPSFVLRDLASENLETLDLTWDAANRLLDTNDAELNTMLYVGYFEHVVPDMGMGPDDRHVEPWIRGSDEKRQRMLLRIAAYWGLDNGRMQEVVEALTRAKVRCVAGLARDVLDGRVGYADV